MSLSRRFATALLRAILRHSSPENQEWANGMLRELDFIQSDWEALFWSLGCTTAIFRHFARGFGRRFGLHSGQKENHMENVGKKAVGVVSGIGIAAGLAVVIFGILMLTFHFFPVLESGRVPWIPWLVVMILPEAIFIVSAVALWRKKRPVAVGILLSAAILATHFIMHIASSGFTHISH